MNDIESRLDVEFAPAWRPDPGDKLSGEVVGIGERAGEYGSYPIVTLRRDDGEELALHAFHSVLASELAALRPKLGDRLAVRYDGKKQTRTGTGSYHGYKVVKDGDEQAVDWSQYAAGDEQSAAAPPASDVPAGTADFAAAAAPAAKAADDDIPF